MPRLSKGFWLTRSGQNAGAAPSQVMTQRCILGVIKPSPRRDVKNRGGLPTNLHLLHKSAKCHLCITDISIAMYKHLCTTYFIYPKEACYSSPIWQVRNLKPGGDKLSHPRLPGFTAPPGTTPAMPIPCSRWSILPLSHWPAQMPSPRKVPGFCSFL